MNKQSWDTYLPALKQTARGFTLSNAESMTDQQVVKALKKSGFVTNENRVRNQRRQVGIVKPNSETRNFIPVPESPFVRYDTPPVIEGDCAVMGDVEFPFHEHEFLNRVLDLCDKWNIRQVALNGDLLHNDSLSYFNPNWQEDTNVGGLSDTAQKVLLEAVSQLSNKKDAQLLKTTMEKIGIQVLPNPAGIGQEWKFARKALVSLRQVFTKDAVLAMGNHDARILNAVSSPMMPEDFKRLLIGDDKWLRVGPYYYGLIKSNGVTWRFTHPKNTSTTPALVAAKLAEKYGMNILQSHNHLWGQQQSLSGKYLGVEIGCVVDGKRLAYKAQRDNAYTEWQNGAAIIRDGFCTLLHPLWTNWKWMMRNG